MKEFVVSFIDEKDREIICKNIIDNGAYYCGELVVPMWNRLGESISNKYIIVYQNTGELRF